MSGATAPLRFHRAMTSLDDRLRRPALLAGIVDADGALCGVQATLLSAHGAAKANVATPRRIIGQLIGGAVRFDEAGPALVIGEGVETMLSARFYHRAPTWALLSAENLARFTPPEQVKTLIVAYDNDAAGERAFAQLCARLGQRIDIIAAPAPASFNDWNDWGHAARF